MLTETNVFSGGCSKGIFGEALPLPYTDRQLSLRSGNPYLSLSSRNIQILLYLSHFCPFCQGQNRFFRVFLRFSGNTP